MVGLSGISEWSERAIHHSPKPETAEHMITNMNLILTALVGIWPQL